MTDDASASDYAALVSNLIQRHGPADRLTALDRSVIEITAKTMTSMRAGDPADAAKLASTVTMLLQTLPEPMSDNADPWDITKLSDEQLAQLDAINVTARSLDRQPWQPPEPEEPAPMGECERRAVALGVYLDQHCHEWKGRALNENERITVMNFLTDLGYPAHTILRNVFKPVFDAELQSAVAKAVIQTEDRFVKATEAKDVTLRSASPSEPRPAGENVYDLPLPKIKPHGDYE